MAWPEFQRAFKHQIRGLSHQRLKELSKEISQTRKARFIENHEPRVEGIERAFTDDELNRFLSVVGDPVYKSAYLVMATLALRPSECANLRGKDLVGDKLRVSGAKGGFSGYFALPEWLLRQIPNCAQDDYLFPSAKMLRGHFAECRKNAGLDECYLFTEPCGRHNVQNRRYRLSMHSFRHYAIQRFFNMTGDVWKTRAFARHRHLESTEQYMKKEIGGAINQVVSTMVMPIGLKN